MRYQRVLRRTEEDPALTCEVKSSETRAERPTGARLFGARSKPEIAIFETDMSLQLHMSHETINQILRKRHVKLLLLSKRKLSLSTSNTGRISGVGKFRPPRQNLT